MARGMLAVDAVEDSETLETGPWMAADGSILLDPRGASESKPGRASLQFQYGLEHRQVAEFLAGPFRINARVNRPLRGTSRRLQS